jgi:hypothetical protein
MKRREFLAVVSTAALLGESPAVADSDGDMGHPSRWLWTVPPPPLSDTFVPPGANPVSCKLSALFGRRLVEAIERTGIDRGELATAAGLTAHGLELVLQGQANIDIVTADRLSDAVGVTLWKMIDRRAEPWT